MSAADSLDACLDALYQRLLDRRGADPNQSYTASLFAGGLDRILKKVGEEATETIVAAKNHDPQRLVAELADLWYHTLVLMIDRGITLQQLAAELSMRSLQSGHAEKASRTI